MAIGTTTFPLVDGDAVHTTITVSEIVSNPFNDFESYWRMHFVDQFLTKLFTIDVMVAEGEGQRDNNF